MPESLIDGQPCDRVPVDDRGLLYGDQLFETVAFHAGRAPLWDLHMKRLSRDAPRLLMPLPDPGLLARECRQLAAGQDRCVIRICLTRGSGGRAYEPPARIEPRRILIRRPWPADLERRRREGICVHTSPVHLAAGSLLAGSKHGSRIEQVLAAEHARRSGVDEALLFDASGRLVEAIAGNLVLVIDDQPVTPELGGAGVAGVGLDWLRSVESGLFTRALGAEDLRQASAVMVINSVAGIRPVRALDGRRLTVDPRCRRWHQSWDRLFECAD